MAGPHGGGSRGNGRGRGRGGGGGHRGKRGGGRGGGMRRPAGLARSSNATGTGERVDWEASAAAIQDNSIFEAYYWDQGIIEPEQWASFMGHLRTPLPTSFRITSGKPTTTVLLEQMRDFYLPFLSNVQFEGEPVPPPKAMPWYPESMGWQIDVKKGVLRKTEQFKQFQQFLVHETEVGNISRQETVSMIPPLFLNVEPHHIVLDMCAAPGSKTAQLIEALHSPLTTSAETYDPCPPGMVIANDADAKRAHMLVHQSSRLPSPNIVVANCDASRWPSIRVPWQAKDSKTVQERTLKFDRILADVPCTGDGTLRKNLMIWKDWHPHNAASLHGLQLRILLRGLANLRNGGRLVYSTCSLNPIENEAVVAAALRECNGAIRLVDQSKEYPDLIRRKGVFTWKVCPTKGKQRLDNKPRAKANQADEKVESAVDVNAEAASEANDGADVEADVGATNDGAPTPTTSYRDNLPDLPYVEKWDDISDELKDKLPQSLWPQGDEQALGLDRCMRILPQDQNTGGFFVAVLEKNDDSDADLTEGMAVGMVRAMATKDAQALSAAESVADTETVVAASTSAPAKRALSSEAEDATEDGRTKRTKAEHEAEAEIAAQPESNVASGTATPVAPALDDVPAHSNGRVKSTEDIGLPGGMPYKEDPMVYVAKDNAQSQAIISFFGLQAGFDPRNLLVRNREATPLRSVYYTGTSVRALISSGGPGRGDHPYGNPLKLRLINCGVRAFARQDSGKDTTLKCRWRVTSDALPVLRPLVLPGKVLQASVADFAFLASNHYPKLSDLPEGGFRTALQAADTGSHLIDVLPGTWNSHTLHRTLCVPIWRAPASTNLMLERQEKSALSYRIFGRDLSNPTGDRQFGQSRAQVQQQANAVAAKRAKADSDAMNEDALQELENARLAASAAAADATASTSAGDADTTAQVQEEGQQLPVEDE